ncbi:hypothetical protein BDY21DRAFT_49968 [Lineolata rhizophorae]|uniref:Uncharacterized protein n=1 Tax=Lineolata rhizophorae TaxID=578093 RepID=A0A6A6NXY9_9PEZI|nr:hypothetical protein BDY21DRAFT_49968 [Lineolata rhizophorae]
MRFRIETRQLRRQDSESTFETIITKANKISAPLNRPIVCFPLLPDKGQNNYICRSDPLGSSHCRFYRLLTLTCTRKQASITRMATRLYRQKPRAISTPKRTKLRPALTETGQQNNNKRRTSKQIRKALAGITEQLLLGRQLNTNNKCNVVVKKESVTKKKKKIKKIDCPCFMKTPEDAC